MPNNIPDDAYALIIGATKCGTTSLYNYLSGHPEICAAVTKEPNYFAKKAKKNPIVGNYSDLWLFDDLVHKYALEASTSYTKYPWEPEVPKNIFDHGIKPKFIYIIRNPFDRICSQFNYMRRTQPPGLKVDDERLLNGSNYFLQLEQYRKYFSIDDILILDFAELTSNPASVLEKIYDFLRLSNVYFPEKYEIFKAANYESKLIPYLRYVPRSLKPVGKKLLRAISPPAKIELTGEQKEHIYFKLKKSMTDLHRFYGIDVHKWGFDV